MLSSGECLGSATGVVNMSKSLTDRHQTQTHLTIFALLFICFEMLVSDLSTSFILLFIFIRLELLKLEMIPK